MENVVFQISKLINRVSNEVDPEKQIKLIVDSISDLFSIDVCSLYLLNEKREPTLFATHGLKADHPISLGEGKGLIGRVITSKHLINVANASTEKGYEFIPSTGEQAFKSYCGVPLVRQGESVGGLVVQNRRAEKLSEDYEALLVTLAAHLAAIVPNVMRLKKGRKQLNFRIEGVKGAPGIAVAPVYTLSSASLDQIQVGQCDNVEAELARWKSLKEEVVLSLNEEKALLGQSLGDGSISGIFDAYQMLLLDPALNVLIESEVTSGANILTALKRALYSYADSFRAMEDSYLAARADDLLHLGNKILNIYNGPVDSHVKDLPKTPIILLGSDIGVTDVAIFPTGIVAGIVCMNGSYLSHTAVLANALGIPAVLGIGRNNHFVQGKRIVLDADNACVIQNPSKAICNEYRRAGKKNSKEVEQLKQLKDLPAQTVDGVKIKLMANSGLVNDIKPSVTSGAEGIGLYRTEIPFMTCQAFPTEDEQIQIYSQIFAAFPSKPINMRVLDIGGDKQLPYFPIQDEMNPALGWRGIRFGLDNAHLLLTQIRSMLLSAGTDGQLNILIPMVSAKEQIQSFKKLVCNALEQLEEEGFSVNPPKVGCMIEVPAAISQIPFWAEELDFVSIGSNDLSQYLLSVDRNNARVANLYDPLHPAVVHEVNRAVTNAKAAGLPISLCGELASEPFAVVLLLGMGLSSLSLGAAYLPKIKKLIRMIDSKDAQGVLQQALTLHTTKEIRDCVNGYMETIGWS
ncbi:phosphoenolpyruvate--protein phosphotransferase [Neptuniibacter marinus]|uniref:phosphoenolpyruvate--protein phosphotransferase n=1 Tax=Neptuniibacter marinus TaxID=1806670 RepID=UPI003B5CAC71